MIYIRTGSSGRITPTPTPTPPSCYPWYLFCVFRKSSIIFLFLSLGRRFRRYMARRRCAPRKVLDNSSLSTSEGIWQEVSLCLKSFFSKMSLWTSKDTWLDLAFCTSKGTWPDVASHTLDNTWQDRFVLRRVHGGTLIWSSRFGKMSLCKTLGKTSLKFHLKNKLVLLSFFFF